jgi:flagellum-specific ATP synthase
MSGVEILPAYFEQLDQRPTWRWCGRVEEANVQIVESVGPPSFVGECCDIAASDGVLHRAEVIGFRGPNVLVMPLDTTQGIQYGDPVLALGKVSTFPVGREMAGRVFNAFGRPIDDKPFKKSTQIRPVDAVAPHPLEREPIREVLSTGVCAIDSMLTVGRGQRVGIMGGSGVGKSTLIGMMARNTAADIIVVGLVGERGREVREFVEEALGEEGRRRSIVIVSTSDQSPLLRMRAAMAATTVAEYHASVGNDVLLVIDSLTRYAMASREVGLAAGQPPATKGYPPSVFAGLARLVERAGNFRTGSITAFYTVLMEGDDQQDPIVDATRSLLDGHIVLSREMASEAWFPPIDILDSLSRLMPIIISEKHYQKANMVRRLMSVYERSSDLIRIGAYKSGTDLELDYAVRIMPILKTFLTQDVKYQRSFEDNLKQLFALETQ